MKGRILTEKMIEDFSCYLKSEEKSENTVGKYLRDVRTFAEYLGGAEITKETVIAYKSRLLAENYAMRSINSMLASLNSLFSFLNWMDCRVKSIRHRLPYKKPQPVRLRHRYCSGFRTNHSENAPAGSIPSGRGDPAAAFRAGLRISHEEGRYKSRQNTFRRSPGGRSPANRGGRLQDPHAYASSFRRSYAGRSTQTRLCVELPQPLQNARQHILPDQIRQNARNKTLLLNKCGNTDAGLLRRHRRRVFSQLGFAGPRTFSHCFHGIGYHKSRLHEIHGKFLCLFLKFTLRYGISPEKIKISCNFFVHFLTPVFLIIALPW